MPSSSSNHASQAPATGPQIWTIGHSTRSLEEFIDLLHVHSIGRLVDVRQYPRSRMHPHFNADALSESLSAHGIQYHHMKSLGGRRRAAPDSGGKSLRSIANHVQAHMHGAYLVGEGLLVAA